MRDSPEFTIKPGERNFSFLLPSLFWVEDEGGAHQTLTHRENIVGWRGSVEEVLAWRCSIGHIVRHLLAKPIILLPSYLKAVIKPHTAPCFLSADCTISPGRTKDLQHVSSLITPRWPSPTYSSRWITLNDIFHQKVNYVLKYLNEDFSWKKKNISNSNTCSTGKIVIQHQDLFITRDFRPLS